jgi:hypothetical protein
MTISGYFAWSFSSYARNSQGEPAKVLLAEWGRDHHLGWFVAQAENFYYNQIDVTPTGGLPTESTVVGGGTYHPSSTASSSSRPHSTAPAVGHPRTSAPLQRRTGSGSSLLPRPPAHLDPPPTVQSPVRSPLPGEGVWQPIGATVHGVPAVYATRVRADAIHTSILASMMWIDTKLAMAKFVPGYQEPGGPNPDNGALPPA